jgi:hypothetical protein
MVVVHTSNPKIIQVLLQICDVMGVEAYSTSDEPTGDRAALLAEVERVKNSDTADFKTFANTQELAEYLGVNWTPPDERSTQR